MYIFKNQVTLENRDSLEKYLKGFRFLPPPSKRCKIKIGVISDTEKAYVTFGNLTANHEIEREFFVYLRKRGFYDERIIRTA